MTNYPNSPSRGPEENKAYYESVMEIKKLVNKIKDNVKLLKKSRGEYLDNIKNNSSTRQSKSIINRTEKTLAKQISKLKNLVYKIYPSGTQNQMMIEEESTTLAYADNELEKQVFNIEKKQKEFLNAQSKENMTSIAANSAYFQLYIYTVIALILLGYLILKK